jgi:pimeloyl-ACP methyl ester carboxylesterase
VTVTARTDVRITTREWRGHRVVHEERGSGPETVVLVHGLLLPSVVNGHTADALVAAGYRVIQPELLGHGRSDAPDDPACYRLDLAFDQVRDLLDDLDIERAVIGGMSLGANLALEFAAREPDRVVGLLCEMPVLERGVVGAMATLAPLWATLRYGGAPVRALFRAVARLPTFGNDIVDTVLGCVGVPASMAAVLHGYATGSVVPPREVREAITSPALVVGHTRDWVHPIDDAELLADQLPSATLLRARHLLELRSEPSRLTSAIVAFTGSAFAASSVVQPLESLAVGQAP